MQNYVLQLRADLPSEDGARRKLAVSAKKELRKCVSASLHAIRAEAHMTQKELAEKAGVSQPEISRIERRAASGAPELYTLVRILDACGFALSIVSKEKQTQASPSNDP